MALTHYNETNSIWTDDRVEALKQLWAAGYSATEIAVELEIVSRSAVLSKAGRLGLTKKESHEHHVDFKDSSSLPEIACEEVPVDLSSAVLGIQALEADGCRYIIDGDAANPAFCPRKRIENGRFWYCAHHLAIVVRPRP